jgi:hypothetical protein
MHAQPERNDSIRYAISIDVNYPLPVDMNCIFGLLARTDLSDVMSQQIFYPPMTSEDSKVDKPSRR